MKSNYSIVSVFTDKERSFRGNTSAVVQLNEEISEKRMQELAEDFNQPATTFIWPKSEYEWHVRWFAPDAEIGLCGHGSLAAIAFINDPMPIKLFYRTGKISGSKIDSEHCKMDISPIYSEEITNYDQKIAKGLGVEIKGYFKNDNKHIVLVENQKVVKSMKPDFEQLRASDPFGYVVTARGDESDFVSRTIVPKVQQLEDPATGSSHAALVPFWSKKLNKDKLLGLQLSKRGGRFDCKMLNDYVELKGEFKIWSKGSLEI